MKTLTKSTLLPKILITYMLAALLWWSYLLFSKNKHITEEKIKLLQLESNVLNKVNDYDITSMPEYQAIITKHNRQSYMIIGEGLVFAFTLIIGVNLINRAHRKEIENTNQQKNFLLSITHELRSPLSSVLLILETLKKRVFPSDKVNELATDAYGEGLRLQKQIQNLLLVTKLNEAYQFNFQQENIHEIIENEVNRWRKLHPYINFKIQKNKDVIHAMIDLESFKSLLNNLIENSIKYANKNPEITVELDVANKHFVLKIADNGIGIPDNEKSKVKQQFYRIGNEDTRTTKGTGLGLFIVDRITLAHQGDFMIEDNYPIGTIMKIRIPKQR